MTMVLRQETAADCGAVRDVVARAFREAEFSAPPVDGEDVPGEATLVEWLRESGSHDERFALVAVSDDRVVGHVMASWGDLDGVPVLGIGPLAVDPGCQGQGIGAALMQELLSRATEAGESVVVLLGDPAYYSRFGFVPARSVGIEADPEWGDYFQACVLGRDGDPDAPYSGPQGRFTYAEPFSRLG